MSGLSLRISVMVVLLSVTSAAAGEHNLTSRERERPVGTDARQEKTHSLTVGARCGDAAENQQAHVASEQLTWEKNTDEQQAGPSDDAATARFTFNNRSDQPIVILSVQSSCGCTAVGIEKKATALEAAQPLRQQASEGVEDQGVTDPRGRWPAADRGAGELGRSLTVAARSDEGETLMQLPVVIFPAALSSCSS